MRSDEGSQRRLNLALYVLVMLCIAGLVFSGVQMWRQHAAAGGDTRGGVAERVWSVIIDRRLDAAVTRDGEQVGEHTVRAVAIASKEEQQRIATALDAADRVVTAFLTLRYDDVDASIDAVLALSTGRFKARYARSAESLRAGAIRSRSISSGDVVWAAYVAGDRDSATVMAAADGTLLNKSVDKPQARAYRVVVELTRRNDRWLARDLEFVS